MSQEVSAPDSGDIATANSADVSQAPASVEADAPQSLESAEDIMAELAKMDSEGEPQPDGDGNPDEDTAQDQEQQQDSPPTEEAGKDQPDPAQVVEYPASWGKDGKELFAKLPPEVQTLVAKREAERETYANTKAEEAAKAAKEVQQLLNYAQHDSGLKEALRLAKLAFEADFAGVDWLNLQRMEPAQYNQLDVARKEREMYIRQLEQHYGALDAHRQQREQQADAERVKAEMQTTLPKLQGLVGDGFDPRQHAGKMAEYLKALGAPEEHIRGIGHGYMLELVTKAMLFDDMGKKAEQAKSKIAAAPPVMKPKGGATASKNADYESAKQRLKRNPGDLDAITAMLNAKPA